MPENGPGPGHGDDVGARLPVGVGVDPLPIQYGHAGALARDLAHDVADHGCRRDDVQRPGLRQGRRT